MKEYKIEFDGGIDLIFELESYSPGEPESHDSPGEAPALEFSHRFEIEDILFVDDLEETRAGLLKIIEGECIQVLMTAEYEKNNQPEPS